MPTKGDPNNKGAAKRATFKPQAKFVRFDLTKAETQALKEATYSFDAAIEDIERFVEQGYKVTFRHDDYNHCEACWLIPPDNHPENAGLILAARGSTALKAMKQLAWIHFYRFKEIWPAPTSKAEEELDD